MTKAEKHESTRPDYSPFMRATAVRRRKFTQKTIMRHRLNVYRYYTLS